jgi:hypothetical protein
MSQCIEKLKEATYEEKLERAHLLNTIRDSDAELRHSSNTMQEAHMSTELAPSSKVNTSLQEYYDKPV